MIKFLSSNFAFDSWIYYVICGVLSLLVLFGIYLMSDVKKLENKIDELRNTLINDHIKRLEEGRCKPQSSGVFINLISNLERAGDHLDYVAEAIVTIH